MFLPYYYKSPNTLTNQDMHNLPLSSTLELWEVLTWPSEGIRLAPHQCSLLDPLFLCCAGIVGSRVCRVPHCWFSKHHQQPLQYKPLNLNDHAHAHMASIAQRKEVPLAAYCGVWCWMYSFSPKKLLLL